MRASPVALAALLASGCGRSGYEALDAAPPGDDGGGPVFDAAPITLFDAALPHDCMRVTTTADEADEGESATPPHMGAGLSLREAILVANAVDGVDCIVFDGAIDALSIDAELPAVDDPDGVVIDGGGSVVLNGGAATTAMLRLAAGGNTVRGLEITSLSDGIVVESGSSVLREVYLRSVGGIAVDIAAGAGAKLGPCLIHDNGATAVRARGSIDVAVVHCTIAGNQDHGIDATLGATGLVVRNSIIAQNGEPGIAVDDQTAIAAIEYSDVSENQLTNCLNCTLGEGCTEADPLFTDVMLEDYTLQPESPAIDTGTDLGYDRNGSGDGFYIGEGPDMGYFEAPLPP